ncbi:hypothetical protein HMPREF9151_02244 [Hoylesella saccharolytica F0055]|uniref:Uncharacterized protein n=1 Tax=Hoylesella saccharolytica F0055 TaxID=1127699 RepID=L1N1G8_9BACT|nr:hypothetical protein HMPREF9151_02244 [Hoylesella saccharolytica F0055]
MSPTFIFFCFYQYSFLLNTGFQRIQRYNAICRIQNIYEGNSEIDDNV